VATHVDELTWHGIKTAVAGLRDVFVDESRGREQDDKEDQASDDDAPPGAG